MRSFPHRNFRAILVSSFVLLLVPAGAQADAGCTRVATPSDSAQQLADSLSAGETGCLRQGNHTGPVTITHGGSAGQPITLRSYPGEKATITGRISVKKGANHVTVEELYLNGRNPTGSPSPTINANDVTFRRNDITNEHTAICFVLGASNVDNSATNGRAARPHIDQNKIHNCGKLPATNHDHGIYVEGSDYARITNNWIYDNADRGIQLYPDAQHTTVTGNVIDGNGSGIIFSGTDGTASRNNEVKGNLLTNAKLRGNAESFWGGVVGTGNVLRANCVKGGRDDDGNGGVNTGDGGFVAVANATSDPEYVNRGGKDFRIDAGSPCRSLYSQGDFVPGPGGGVRPSAGISRLRRSALLKLSVPRRTVRYGRRVKVLGRANLSRLRPGTIVTILAKSGGRWKRVARRRVRRNGTFVLRRTLRPQGRTVRLRAVASVGRSKTLRLRVRR